MFQTCLYNCLVPRIPHSGGKTEQQQTPTAATLTATGDAAVDAATATLTLTPAQPSKAGSVFLAARVPLFSYQLIGDSCGRELAFSSNFSVTLTRPAASGSEGFAFVVAFDATPPSTPVVGGMGYAGMGARNVAVEFDTSMDAGNSDPDSNHVGINTGGNVTSVVTAKPSTPLNDGTPKHVWIDYDPSSGGSLRVFLSSQASPRPTTPLLSARISLCEELAPSPSEYTFAIGFTAASATQAQSHVVSAWTLSTYFPIQPAPGDCWAYAVVGSVEAALGILSNTSAAPVLSVEQLKVAMKVGCSGSTPSQAFQLLLKLAQKGGGLMPESQWAVEKVKKPAKAGSSSPLCAPLMKPLAKLFGVACSKGSDSLPGGFPIKGFESTSFYGWFGLLLAVQRQPVVVHIEASASSFKNYDGDPDCFTFNLNHVVLLVGYRLVGKDSRFPKMAPPFWIIRNSWGPDWGDGGHMRMDIQGGDGVCGINSLPGLYPVVREDARKAAKRNPCAVGTCVNDGAGSYSCVCPPGFRQGTTVESTFSCAPGDTSNTYTVLSPNVRCSDVFPVYSLTLAQFQAQNGDTCAALAEYFKVHLSCPSDDCTAAFQALNPSLDCSANGGLLQPEQAVCVERIKKKVGLIPVCSQYYLVQSAETCESIRNVPYPPLSPVDFFRLNPGMKCNRLIPNTDVGSFTGFEVRACVCSCPFALLCGSAALPT
ncbi:unnamed protein product [Closterium sp. Naga37s-1]|nr:unnamed protein product [Closterium sp. Naga37s-1]